MAHALDTSGVPMTRPTIVESVRELLSTFVERSKNACFVEWIAGTVVASAYGQALFVGNTEVLGQYGSNLIPLVFILAVTRVSAKWKTYG